MKFFRGSSSSIGFSHSSSAVAAHPKTSKLPDLILCGGAAFAFIPACKTSRQPINGKTVFLGKFAERKND